MIFHHILPTILIMMLGAKAPNYDTYGLLRAAHSLILPQASSMHGDPYEGDGGPFQKEALPGNPGSI